VYIANYLDRTSVAYAAIGMSRDLGFSDRVYGLGAGVFFLSYLSLQIPGALLVERWSARRMISATMVAWGSLTALTALVQTPAQLYAARFVLGAAEAAFFPGVVVYLSHWFTRRDRAKASSNFMAAIPVSFVIGSPLAGWVIGHAWLGQAGWRWLFILEGLPAIVLGAVAFFYLTDRPADAAWLAPAQRQWLDETLRSERPAGVAEMTVAQAFRSRTVLLLALVTFLIYFENYSFIFWFPTMLKRLSGLSDLNVGLLGAIPYVASFFAMQLNGWHSDRSRERRWHVAVPVLVAAAALVGLIAAPGSPGRALLLFTLVGAGGAYLPVLWALPGELLSRSGAAAAVGIVNATGSIAGFAAPYALGYLHTRTGSFTSGLAAMLVTALAGGLLVLRVPRSPPAAGVQLA
jgi:ACS family tartrate transporter-like MFS transporter